MQVYGYRYCLVTNIVRNIFRRYKVIQVWNDKRWSKWWKINSFGWTKPSLSITLTALLSPWSQLDIYNSCVYRLQLHAKFYGGSCLPPRCPGRDSTAADHKSSIIYSSGFFGRGQRKAITLPACCRSVRQQTSTRELHGNCCRTRNWKYFHS